MNKINNFEFVQLV